MMPDLSENHVPPTPTIYMTPEEFISWRYAANLSKTEACKALGICRNTLRSYEAGKHIIPKYILLACERLGFRDAA